LLPAWISLEQGFRGNDQLSHDSGDGDLVGLSGGDELLILRFEIGVEAMHRADPDGGATLDQPSLNFDQGHVSLLGDQPPG